MWTCFKSQGGNSYGMEWQAELGKFPKYLKDIQKYLSINPDITELIITIGKDTVVIKKG